MSRATTTMTATSMKTRAARSSRFSGAAPVSCHSRRCPGPGPVSPAANRPRVGWLASRRNAPCHPHPGRRQRAQGPTAGEHRQWTRCSNGDSKRNVRRPTAARHPGFKMLGWSCTSVVHAFAVSSQMNVPLVDPRSASVHLPPVEANLGVDPRHGPLGVVDRRWAGPHQPGCGDPRSGRVRSRSRRRGCRWRRPRRRRTRAAVEGPCTRLWVCWKRPIPQTPQYRLFGSLKWPREQ